MERILVIDDDPGFSKLLVTILSGEGYSVETAASVAEALQTGQRAHFHLVLTDLRLPDGDGIEVLRRWRERDETPFIVITAFGTVASAVEAMKCGATDYLTKPLGSPEQLRLLVRKVLSQGEVTRERDLLREREAAEFGCVNMVAEDPRMTRLIELVRKVAPTNATVLVTGETGVGKELIAHCIHDHSARAERIFVPVNCASLAPTLIESELFGHERGAFTGASGQHLGRFERAHGGTLFLDEIGELDTGLQAKLLRVLQEKTLERVGGARPITVDVRVIAATNRNLANLVSEGKFREDLYYRINSFPIEVPALRDRAVDIPALAKFFLDRAARNLGRKAPALSLDAVARLCSYAWPGNVRELENMMERVAILIEGTVLAADLPITESARVRPVAIQEIERIAIENALAENGGNRTRAAQQLRISRRTLQYRLKEYGME
jgi:two-component system response regulator AtoC